VNIQDLGSLGELIAAIATVGTLFYLAYQIKQSTLHSRAYTQRDILKEVISDHSKSAQLSSITRRGLSEFADLNGNEKLEFAGIMVALTATFESSLRLYRSGLVDKDLFTAHRAWILSWLTSPGGIQWWNTEKQVFSVDVREYISSAINDKIDLPTPITESIPFYGLIDGE